MCPDGSPDRDVHEIMSDGHLLAAPGAEVVGPGPRPADADAGRRRIRLVPVALVPTSALYEIAYLTGAADRWRTRGRTVTIETFASLLLGTGDAAFAVVDAGRDGAVVGYVGLYNVDEVSLVGSISAFFDTTAPEAMYAAGTAIHLFANHVFRVIGLRKLMIESPASGSAYLDRAVRWSGVATKEGTLRQHARVGAVYEDLDLYAVWAEAYLARYGEADASAWVENPSETFAAVVGAIEDVMATEILDPAGGVSLRNDLDMDSLALIEVLDRLEGGELVELDAIGDGESLTIQSIVEALERVRQ